MKEKEVFLYGLFAIFFMFILAAPISADVIDPRYPYIYHSSYETSSIYLVNTTYNGDLIENYSVAVLMCYEYSTNFRGPSELNISFFDSEKNCYWTHSYNQYKSCSSEGIFSGDYSIEGCSFLYRYPLSEVTEPDAKFVIFVPGLNKTFISDKEIILNQANTFSAELFQDGNINIRRMDSYSFTPSPSYSEDFPWGILFLPLLTVIIELVAAFVFLKAAKTKRRIFRILGFVLLANIISWPVALILFSLPVLFLAYWGIVLAEGFAIVFEAYFIYWTNKKFITLKKSFWLSLAINAASFFLGLLILFQMV